MPAETLEHMLDPTLELRLHDGEGRLQLAVMNCTSRQPVGEGNPVLAYSYVVLPVAGRSAPIALTRVPSDGWLFIRQAAASGAARALMEEFGYPVVASTQDFTVSRIDGRLRVEVELQFGSGRIWIEARPMGEPAPWSGTMAYIGTGAGYVSAFFGEEVSDRLAASAIVRLEGQTPLSGLGLTTSSVVARLDRGLTSDRVYWRLPAG